LEPWGFRSSLGRHYRDTVSGKLREIDLLAEIALSGWVRFFAVVECKRSATGAWVVRETDQLQPAYRNWAPLTTRILEKRIRGLEADFLLDFATWRSVDPGAARYAFSVVEATDETNDAAHAAIAQAVSGAMGWLDQLEGPALAVPVVVVDAPLFALCHGEGQDEPLEPIQWRRILWGETPKQTIVDVVTADHVSAYASDLRSSLDRAARVAQTARIGDPGNP